MPTPPLDPSTPPPDQGGPRERSLDAEAPDETIHLPLMEETLEAQVVAREQGKVLIHTRVETEPVQTSVDLHHDDVVIDQVEVNDLVAERREPWYEGATLMVPVYEEVLVTETKLLLRTIIRVHNKRRHEQVRLRGTVRREVVEIEEIDT
jgi:stress response protein YsnF